MAAGLTIDEGDLDAFACAFDEEVARWRDPSVPANRVETDGELSSDEIALETAQAVREGGPWGQAFPEPSFDGVFAVKNARVVGEKHLKMWVTSHDGARSFDAIAFNFKGAEENPPLPDGDVRLVYRLDINDYKGERRLQLLVDHVLR
jgi:single-stranded-DNA-specific exonuclease